MNYLNNKLAALVSSIKEEYKVKPDATLFEKLKVRGLATFMLMMLLTIYGFVGCCGAGIILGIVNAGLNAVGIEFPQLIATAVWLVYAGFISLGGTMALCGCVMVVVFTCLPYLYFKYPEMFENDSSRRRY